jgi:MYXO-CTERM domain-containing protein
VKILRTLVLVALMTTPAFAAWTVGPEINVGGNPVTQALTGYPTQLFSGPGQLLLVWAEGTTTILYRVDASTATVLDPKGVVLGNTESVYAVADATGWQVFSSAVGTDGIVMQHYGTDGTLGAPVTVTPSTTTGFDVFIAAADLGGGKYGVAWDHGGTEIRYTTIAGGAAATDQKIVDLSTCGGISVASSGAGWLVAWHDYNIGEVDGALVDTGGAAGAPFLIHSGANQVHAIHDGTRYVVTWGLGIETLTGSSDVTDLVASDSVTYYPGLLLAPGGGYVVVANDGSSTSTVEPLSTGGVFGTASTYTGYATSAIATDGTLFALGGLPGVYVQEFAMVSNTAVFGNQLTVIYGRVNTENDPSVAYDGSQYVASWDDSRGAQVFAARVGTDGTLKDPSGIQISDPSTSTGASYPFTAAIPGDTLIAYTGFISSNSSILDSIFSPGGSFVTPAVLAPNASLTGTATDGTGFVVGWFSLADGSSALTHVDATGATLDSTPTAHTLLSLGGGAGRFFAFTQSGSNIDAEIFKIDGSNALAPVKTITNVTPSRGNVVATDGTSWSVFTIDSTTGTLYQTPIDASLTAGSPVTLLTGASYPTSAGWDGSAYVVVTRTAAGLMALRVAGDGTILEPATLVDATGQSPVVASAGGGKTFVVYAANDQSAGVLASRVKGRLLSEAAPPPVDAGVGAPDASAGQPDAGAGQPDAAPGGTPDAAAGAQPDAASTTSKSSGCGCIVGGDAPPTSALGLLAIGALLVIRRRRR